MNVPAKVTATLSLFFLCTLLLFMLLVTLRCIARQSTRYYSSTARGNSWCIACVCSCAHGNHMSAAVLPSSRITEPLEKRLTHLVQRHDILLSKLNSNTLESKELVQVSKELAGLSNVKTLYGDWEKSTNDLVQLHDMLSSSESQDEEMVEMAKEEYTDIMGRIGEIERDLVSELVPKDAADEASAILEIRAGAGGDEAALFSADMARMYERFAQLQRWKWEILSKSEDAGFKGLKVYIHIGAVVDS